jgi:hypothetical protein
MRLDYGSKNYTENMRHGFIRANVSVVQDIDYWLKLDRYLLIVFMLNQNLSHLKLNMIIRIY